MREKIEVLEHHSHLLPMPIDVDLFGRQLHALKINLPGGRLLEQIETPQQGGFAGAGRSDDRDHLAFFHIQIAMIQSHDIPMIVFLD